MCQDSTKCDTNELIQNSFVTLTIINGNNKNQYSEKKNDENQDNGKDSEFSFTLLNEIKHFTDLNVKTKTIVTNAVDNFKYVEEFFFHEKNQIYVSKKTKLRILKNFHDSSTSNYFKRNKKFISLKK